MKRQRFLLRSLLFPVMTSALAALVLGACATAPKGDYVQKPLGSTAAYAVHGTGSYAPQSGQVTNKWVERTWEGKPIAAFESRGFAILVNSNGAWPAILTPGGKPIISWDPPIGYNFPLVVGKTTTKTYQMTLHARNKTVPVQVTWKVEAYEDVTVPAGTFKAFKIHQSTSLGDENTSWYNPEVGNIKLSYTRTAKSPSGPGTRVSELVSQTIAK